MTLLEVFILVALLWISYQLQTLSKGYKLMAADLTLILAKVEANTTLVGSISQLLDNIHAELIAAKNDPVAVQAIADKIQANNDAIVAAVTRNTDVTPAP